MKRKLVRIGKSLAVTLPAEVVRRFALRKGQEVEVSVDPTTGAVTIRPGIREFDGGKVTSRFRRTIDDLLERRSDLYRRLAE